MATIATLVVKLSADTGDLLRGLQQGQGSLKALAAEADRTARELQPLGLAFSGMAAAGTLAMKSFVNEAKDFNQQAALMEVAARSSGTSFDILHDAALRVGGDVRLVGVSATGAADAITGLYKAGLSTTDIFGDLNKYMTTNAELSGALRASIDLAAASELDMAAAADVVSISMSTFNLKAEDATDIADNFVAAADASVSSVSSLAEAMKNVGPTAAAFGWRLEDVNTALAILSTRGIDGAEAGTSLKSMMTNLMRPTKAVREALDELNVALYDERGVMLELPDILDQLEASMAGLTEEQRNQYIQTLAGTYGMKALNTLLSEGTAGWQEMEAAIAKAATAQEIAGVQTETTTGKLEALEGAWETTKIAMGESYLNAVNGAVEGLTRLLEGFNKLPQAQKDVVAGLLGVTTGLAGVSGATILAVPRIISLVDSMKVVAGVAGDVYAGLQLLKSGASAAEVASLGLGGSLAAAAAPAAALAATTVVLAEAHRFNANIQQQEATVADRWAQMLQSQVEEGKSAIEIARKYAEEQAEVNRRIQQAGLLGEFFINKEKVAQARTEDLNRALAQSSRSYEEYRRAAEAAGLVMERVVDRGMGAVTRSCEILSKAEWEAAAGAGAMGVEQDRLAMLLKNMAAAQETAADSTEEALIALEEEAAAAEAVAEQMDKIQDTLIASAESWTNYYQDVEEQQRNYEEMRAELEAAGNAEALARLEEQHQRELEANRRKIGELLIMQAEGYAQAYGIPATELNKLVLEISRQYGIIDEQSYQTTQAMGQYFEQWAATGGQATSELMASLNATTATIEAGKTPVLEYQAILADTPTDIETNVHHNFGRAKAEADSVRQAINSIPRDVHVTVHVSRHGAADIPSAHLPEGYQRGTLRVPHTGLYQLHAGEAVLPPNVAEFFRREMGGVTPAVGGAGGVVIQNYFGPNSVRSDEDVYRIAEAIERSLSLRGVRRAIG